MEPLQRPTQALTDHYTVEKKIGAGGMADVYLAHDVRHHRKVGIKVMHRELALRIGVERLLREIETTSKLQHPHILPLFDSGQVEDTRAVRKTRPTSEAGGKRICGPLPRYRSPRRETGGLRTA